MKIIHIFDHSFPLQDGYSARSLAILQGQKKRDWEVFPLTGTRQDSISEQAELLYGINFYRTINKNSIFSKIPVVKQIWSIWLVYKRLISLIEDNRPDVLHAHSPALNGIAAIYAGRRFHIPVVYEVRAFWEDAAVDQGTSTSQGWRYKMTRSLENYVFRNVQQVTAICEGLKNEIENRLVFSDLVTVVPNAVEFERFCKPLPPDSELISKFELTEGHTIGFIGSFYDYEGLDLAIRAMPCLLDKYQNIKLLLVGSGLQYQNLRKLVVELKLESKVLFTGKVPFSEVERYYSVIDILVYPRKQLRLTNLVTPLKPLEAMAQQKIFVASDVGGHRELIKNGETGILFKAEDINSFIISVNMLLSSKELQDKIRKNGLDFVKNDRNWPRSIEKYEKVYKTACHRIFV